VVKPKQSLGRKVKMSQPVAIDFTTYITLVEGKVIKGPIAPKMEVMEKWIVSGGRDISIDRDHESGHYLAILTAKSIDGQVDFEGKGETMALAVTEAIVDFLKAQPKPDPEGKDLPLFKGNGGVASVAEIELEREAKGDVDEAEAPDEDGPKDLEVQLDDALTTADVADADQAPAPESQPPVREWTWLHIINPGDAKRWKQDAPRFDDAPVVEFEEGDDANERGWYLDPDFFYDREVGQISQRNPVPGQSAVVWSRDTDPMPAAVEATRVYIGADD
jgi:hypothetical protein